MDDAFHVLALLSAVLGVATLLVFALRPLLLRVFGAGVSYACWLLVPMMLAAGLLPRPQQEALISPAQFSAPATVRDAIVIVAAPGAQRIPVGPLLAVWLTGAALVAGVMAVQHRRFVRGMGELHATPVDGVYRAASDRSGPALVGVLRPKIVVPHDFELRYTAQEQELILAHERVHARRGDALSNVLAGTLLALFWFHPLAHVAVRCFRLDQELACDAAVLDDFPGARRSYADAIFKTQLASSGQAFACTWQSTHPLKGRIMSIARPPVGKHVRIAGQWTLAVGIAASCGAAWALGAQAEAPVAATPVAAAQAAAAPGVKPAPTPKKAEAAPALASAAGAARTTPAVPAPPPAPAPAADRVDVAIQLKVNDSSEQSIAMKGVGVGDNTATFSSGEGSERCDYEFRVMPTLGTDFYQVSAKAVCAGRLSSAPRLVAKLGQPSRIRAGEQKAGRFDGFDMTVMVSKAE